MKPPQRATWHYPGFWSALAAVAFLYALFLALMLCSTIPHTTSGDFWRSLTKPETQHSIRLSLFTCTLSALIALLIAVPTGYLLSRGRFRGRQVLDAFFDIPIVLPPMVTGICLLILFQWPGFRDSGFVYTVRGVVLAQVVIGAAFAIRTMRQTFDGLSARPEEVAMTLGCSRAGAVWRVTLPAAKRGLAAAFGVAWARSLGEFGPILVFAGATRMKTEVLPTTVWLELSVGNLEAAVAVSLLLVLLAMAVLVFLRFIGPPESSRLT